MYTWYKNIKADKMDNQEEFRHRLILMEHILELHFLKYLLLGKKVLWNNHPKFTTIIHKLKDSKLWDREVLNFIMQTKIKNE
jgi:hypothetical protein